MDIAKQVLNININDILPNRFQPRIRFSEEALTELTNSIKEHGVIQPITVRPIGNKYEIVAGERRYKASVLAGKETIPAIVVNLDDNSCAELALIENVQRQDLTPIEEAISYQKILDMGSLTQEALAIKLGKNQSTIANKLRLLNLDEEVQKALLENRISERHARSLLKITDNEEQRKMLNRITSERLTVRRTDEEINKLLSQIDFAKKNKEEMVGEDIFMNENNNMNNNFNSMSPQVGQQNILNQGIQQQANVQNPFGAIPNIPIIEPATQEQGTQQGIINNNIPQGPQAPENFEVPMQQPMQQPAQQPVMTSEPIVAQPSFENIQPNQPVQPTVDVNKLIEQANQITPEFNIPSTPIEETPASGNEIFTPFQSVQQSESSSNPATFNSMEIETPMPTMNNQDNSSFQFFPENNVQNNMPPQSNTSLNDNELRPVQFFNMNEEPQATTTGTSNNMGEIFSIPAESVNNSQGSINVQPEPSVTVAPTNEFIDNLEEQAVNMDFGMTQPVVPDFNPNIPTTPIESSQVESAAIEQQVSIPSAPTIPSTVNIPQYINENVNELQPKRPEFNQQPSRQVNIRQAIDEVRQCTAKLENAGFKVDTEEYDLENNYQVIITIGKE